MHPESPGTHYAYEPEVCPTYCAEVEAERDELAAELYLYKIKYGEILPEEKTHYNEAPAYTGHEEKYYEVDEPEYTHYDSASTIQQDHYVEEPHSPYVEEHHYEEDAHHDDYEEE